MSIVMAQTTPARLRAALVVGWILCGALCLVVLMGWSQHRHAVQAVGIDAAPSVVAAHKIKIYIETLDAGRSFLTSRACYHCGMSTDNANSRRGLLLRSTFTLAGMVIVFGVLLFLPAGIGWRKGWLFLVVFLAFTILSSAYLWRANPDIFIARSKIHQGTKSWDKVLMSLILVSFFAIFPIAGLDARWHGSAVPIWLVAVGYLLFALGFALSTWVYAVNKFAEPSVRIQSDRQQKVIDTGPYAIVRHPLYAVSFFLVVGMALALGSFWALIPVAVGTAVLLVRTVLEDSMLQCELAGYKDYASRVRYRLIPGVW
jgi:protein-S-isoprenylcysteine O-methyltransferase Ste14